MRLVYLGYAGAVSQLIVEGKIVRIGERVTLSERQKAALEKHGHSFVEIPEEPPRVERKAARNEGRAAAIRTDEEAR